MKSGRDNKETDKTKQFLVVSPAALGAANGNKRDSCSFSSHVKYGTSQKGNLLGTIRPIWIKVLESEQRISWLKKMLDKGLCVRDLEAYVKSEHGKLRSEALRVQECERGIIMGLMRLKWKDV